MDNNIRRIAVNCCSREEFRQKYPKEFNSLTKEEIQNLFPNEPDYADLFEEEVKKERVEQEKIELAMRVFSSWKYPRRPFVEDLKSGSSGLSEYEFSLTVDKKIEDTHNRIDLDDLNKKKLQEKLAREKEEKELREAFKRRERIAKEVEEAYRQMINEKKSKKRKGRKELENPKFIKDINGYTRALVEIEDYTKIYIPLSSLIIIRGYPDSGAEDIAYYMQENYGYITYNQNAILPEKCFSLASSMLSQGKKVIITGVFYRKKDIYPFISLSEDYVVVKSLRNPDYISSMQKDFLDKNWEDLEIEITGSKSEINLEPV